MQQERGWEQAAATGAEKLQRSIYNQQSHREQTMTHGRARLQEGEGLPLGCGRGRGWWPGRCL